jgi:formamidopyrimidine-DNA glycosylase
VPELPEVETLARHLRRRVVGRRISAVRIITPSTVRSPSPARFTRALRGRVIQAVGRRGKFLLFRLDGDLVLAVHLRMTGDLVITPARRPLDRYTRVVLGLGGHDLRFDDPRRFGHMDLLPRGGISQFEPLRRMGPEPLARSFTLEQFRAVMATRRGVLKPLLLRQEVVAGIGNLYADEILFQARLHPGRRVESLRPVEVRRLYLATRQVLRRATSAMARPGDPVGALLSVREEEGICPRCGRPLTVTRLGGRATFFCSFCQREGTPRAQAGRVARADSG